MWNGTIHGMSKLHGKALFYQYTAINADITFKKALLIIQRHSSGLLRTIHLATCCALS